MPRTRAEEMVPIVLEALRARGEAIGHGFKLHVAKGDELFVPSELFHQTMQVMRAEGPVEEPIAETLAHDQLGREWEWEATPEVSLKLCHEVDEAIHLFNTQSPRFAASLISEDPTAFRRFFDRIDANKDGKIDRDEARAAMERSREAGAGGPARDRRPEGDRPEGERRRPDADQPKPEGDKPADAKPADKAADKSAE